MSMKQDGITEEEIRATMKDEGLGRSETVRKLKEVKHMAKWILDNRHKPHVAQFIATVIGKG